MGRFLARLVVALGLAGFMMAPAMPAPAADALAVDGFTADAAVTAKTSAPLFDRNLMMFGCMTGLVVGTLSTLLPPVAGWALAGVWWGGLGTMIVRGGLGCVYGGLAGAVSSAARATYRWLDATWRAWTGRQPAPPPLPVEGVSGT